jgi:hypothetical protein
MIGTYIGSESLPTGLSPFTIVQSQEQPLPLIQIDSEQKLLDWIIAQLNNPLVFMIASGSFSAILFIGMLTCCLIRRSKRQKQKQFELIYQ